MKYEEYVKNCREIGIIPCSEEEYEISLCEKYISSAKAEINFYRRKIKRIKREYNPKTNMDFVRKILSEATRSLSIDEAVSIFLSLHPLTCKNPEKRAKQIFLQSNKYNVASKIIEVDGKKYISGKEFEKTDIIGANEKETEIIEKRLEQLDHPEYVKKVIVASPGFVDRKGVGARNHVEGQGAWGVCSGNDVYIRNINSGIGETNFNKTLTHEFGHVYDHTERYVVEPIKLVSRVEIDEMFAEKFSEYMIKNSIITSEIVKEKILKNTVRALNKISKQKLYTLKSDKIQYCMIMFPLKWTIEELEQFPEIINPDITLQNIKEGLENLYLRSALMII